jgi:branched-subunit amino acid ABC-type transport system permease component
MHFDTVANVQLLINGLAMGSIYALVALVFVLILQRGRRRQLRPG